MKSPVPLKGACEHDQPPRVGKERTWLFFILVAVSIDALLSLGFVRLADDNPGFPGHSVNPPTLLAFCFVVLGCCMSWVSLLVYIFVSSERILRDLARVETSQTEQKLKS